MDLKNYMIGNDLTASELASRASPPIPIACITRYLRGERGLSPQMAARISAATGGEVTISELLYPDGLPENARLIANS